MKQTLLDSLKTTKPEAVKCNGVESLFGEGLFLQDNTRPHSVSQVQ